MSEGITDGTTHVVVLPAAGSPARASEPAAVQPGQVLAQLLKEHGGLPALKTLHRRLLSQQAHIVAQTCVSCDHLSKQLSLGIFILSHWADMSAARRVQRNEFIGAEQMRLSLQLAGPVPGNAGAEKTWARTAQHPRG